MFNRKAGKQKAAGSGNVSFKSDRSPDPDAGSGFPTPTPSWGTVTSANSEPEIGWGPTPTQSWNNTAVEGAGWSIDQEDDAHVPPGLTGGSGEPLGEVHDLEAKNDRLARENELLKKQYEQAAAQAEAARASAAAAQSVAAQSVAAAAFSMQAYPGMGYPGVPYPGMPGMDPAAYGGMNPVMMHPHMMAAMNGMNPHMMVPMNPAMMMGAPGAMPMMMGAPGATQSSGGSKTKAAVPDGPPPVPGGGDPTTLMLRNLPNDYTRQMMLDLLDQQGFTGVYDFFYLPIDFKSNAGLGYAFVNLVTPDEVKNFWETFEGFSSWSLPSQKVCTVSWSNPHQGLDSHIERFKNSFLMHEEVPDEHKPVLFNDGVRIAFPPPTRKLQPPRPRQGGKP